MPAGLKVYTPDGVVVIDENFKNLEFKSKIVVTVPSNRGYYDPSAFASFVTPGGANQVLAYRVISGDSFYVQGRSGATYILGTFDPNPCVVEVFIFDEPYQYTMGTTGLVVRDASGAVTFNSDLKYMRVRAYHKVPDAYMSEPEWGIETAPPLSVTLPAGNYAAVLGAVRFGRYAHPGSGDDAWTYVLRVMVDHLRITSTELSVRSVLGYVIESIPHPIPPTFYQKLGGSVTIIDVSNL